MILAILTLLILPTWLLWERFSYKLKGWIDVYPLLIACVFIALSHLFILAVVFSVVGK